MPNTVYPCISKNPAILDWVNFTLAEKEKNKKNQINIFGGAVLCEGIVKNSQVRWYMNFNR